MKINLNFLNSIHNFSCQQLYKITSKINNKMFYLKKKELSLLLKKSDIYEFNFLSEINGNEKIEHESSYNFIDRLSHISIPNVLYGSVPNTLSGDGDPVDVFVIFPNIYDTTKIIPGTIFNVIPLFKIKTFDNKEEDDKVISIPSFLLNYFVSGVIITQQVFYILCYIYSQNYFGKEVSIENFEDYENTVKYVKSSFLKI